MGTLLSINKWKKVRETGSTKPSAAKPSDAAVAVAVAANMSEGGGVVSQFAAVTSTLAHSFSLLLHHKSLFFSIFALLALPLSFLLSSLSLSSYPLKSHILYLQSIVALTSTRVEARHVMKESRESAILLLRLNLLLSVPSSILSLLAAATSVSVSHSIHSLAKPITLRASLYNIKSNWARPFTTSICIYAVMLLYSALPVTLSALIGGSGIQRFAVWVIGTGLEIYLMAVLGMGLVVSIVEKRFGWDAIRVGSDLMEGRRVCGYLLSGLLALVTAMIGWRLECLAMINDWDELGEFRWTAWMDLMGWEGVGLTGLYGLLVMWGYVVTTVFYCDCSRRHVVREDGREHDDGGDISL